MATLFTRIIEGELPGRFIHRDEHCVAFLTIEPLSPGHTLVVPIAEIDHWLDLPPDLAAHLMDVAQRVGRSIDTVFAPEKVGLMIAGLEVPHVHLHVSAINTVHDLDFAHADRHVRPEDLDRVADKLRAAMSG